MGQPEKLSVRGRSGRATRPRTRAIPRSTSTGSGGAMTPISRRPIPRRCCIGRAKARKPSWRISATCCWTIDRGVSPTVCATHATGTAERDAAVLLLEASASPGSPVGADKGYDVARFVADVRVQDVTPHVAQKVRGSAIDGRTTRVCGLSRESAETKTRGTGLRLDEDRRRPAQAPASRHRPGGLAAHLRRHRLSLGPVAESGGEVSLIAGRGCRWPPRRDSVSPCAPWSGGRDTHDGHENSPILVFFSNLLDGHSADYRG